LERHRSFATDQYRSHVSCCHSPSSVIRMHLSKPIAFHI
jgi:hypothetical protein